MASDYPFGFFKLLSNMVQLKIIHTALNNTHLLTICAFTYSKSGMSVHVSLLALDTFISALPLIPANNCSLGKAGDATVQSLTRESSGEG
jgi:hypothetical protein